MIPDGGVAVVLVIGDPGLIRQVVAERLAVFVVAVPACFNGLSNSLLLGRGRGYLGCPSPRRFRNACLLLPVHLDQRQAGVAGDDLEDGVG